MARREPNAVIPDRKCSAGAVALVPDVDCEGWVEIRAGAQNGAGLASGRNLLRCARLWRRSDLRSGRSAKLWWSFILELGDIDLDHQHWQKNEPETSHRLAPPGSAGNGGGGDRGDADLDRR